MTSVPRKTLINNPDTIVNDAIEGLCLLDSRIKRLGNLNVIVRADILDYKQNHVTLISGGGSGHEPSHAGFVGQGMLSAAVCGNVFASPSVSAILATIRACAGPKGVLLIVKNYTGDRLNFGMALEQARQEGIKVMMAIIADDVALEEGKGITGGRGVAGTLFVHKIAGALAANKETATLEQVHAAAINAAKNMGTMGIALSTCTLPGAVPSQRLAEPTLIEVGMGIHGEAGREQQTIQTSGAANQVADIMVESIVGGDDRAPRLAVASGEKVAVLLNNLGTMPAIEMLIMARGVMLALKQRNIRVIRCFSGPYMTSLDMNGVSLTVLKLDDHMLELLDTQTLAPAWIPSSDLSTHTSISNARLDMTENDDNGVLDPQQILPTLKSSSSSQSSSESSTRVKGGIPCPQGPHIVKAIAEKIISIEAQLTEFDVICGDGDCGIVMKAGAMRLLKDLESSDEAILGSDSSILFDFIANSISQSMGGSSGALLEIFFRRCATYMAANPTSDKSAELLWQEALSDGLDAIKLYGGARKGMRTMIDALEPGIIALKTGSLKDAVQAAKEGAEATKTMIPLAGRSNYVSKEHMQGIPDPGAFAVAAAFEAAAGIA